MLIPSITDSFSSTFLAAAAYKPTNWIELSKHAFDHNITLYRSVIGTNLQLAIVVKSNAYGHGLLPIGRFCQENPKIDWLCTTSLSEALQLREHGITKPILVLSILDTEPAMAIKHNIDLVVYDMRTVLMLNHIAAKLQKKVFLHLKIDTGLSRFGFFPQEALAIILQIQQLPWIALRGICSHFSQADVPDQEYTQLQSITFTTLLQQLNDHGVIIPLQHLSNTASSTSLTQTHNTFARIGAGAYGLQPSEFTIKKAQECNKGFVLKPVLTWKTTIMYIRTIPANTPVGYGNSYVTPHQTTLAVIPVGYYEGYDRRLGNKGIVWIATKAGLQQAPIIGRICMNVAMIDITAVAQAAIGDTVILVGNYEHITAHEIATTIQGFNPREITTRINPLIARVVTD